MLVLPRRRCLWAEAGPGFAYAAPGYDLQESWKERMTNAVTAAELVSGWLPIFGLDTIAELEPMLRDRIVKKHMRGGVRVLDPAAVYIDPRVEIGRGTTILPAPSSKERPPSASTAPSAPRPW